MGSVWAPLVSSAADSLDRGRWVVEATPTHPQMSNAVLHSMSGTNAIALSRLTQLNKALGALKDHDALDAPDAFRDCSLTVNEAERNATSLRLPKRHRNSGRAFDRRTARSSLMPSSNAGEFSCGGEMSFGCLAAPHWLRR
jgi:hypothetical protein